MRSAGRPKCASTPRVVCAFQYGSKSECGLTLQPSYGDLHPLLGSAAVLRPQPGRLPGPPPRQDRGLRRLGRRRPDRSPQRPVGPIGRTIHGGHYSVGSDQVSTAHPALMVPLPFLGGSQGAQPPASPSGRHAKCGHGGVGWLTRSPALGAADKPVRRSCGRSGSTRRIGLFDVLTCPEDPGLGFPRISASARSQGRSRAPASSRAKTGGAQARRARRRGGGGCTRRPARGRCARPLRPVEQAVRAPSSVHAGVRSPRPPAS